MIIEWIAHSCFKVRLQSGTELLFDPFDESIGYSCVNTTADIVFVSHNHADHNYIKNIKGDYTLVNTPGAQQIGPVNILGIPTFHDKCQGAERGNNIAFRVEAEGLTLLHMGDIGHLPDEDFYEAIGNVDILFIPVGGLYTIDADEALAICKRIDPNLIIPMHYKTLFLEMDVDSVYRFTDAAGRYFDRSRLGSNSFEITADNKKKRTRIIVMENSLDH